jgi:hypothetical protein
MKTKEQLMKLNLWDDDLINLRKKLTLNWYITHLNYEASKFTKKLKCIWWWNSKGSWIVNIRFCSFGWKMMARFQ